ncbi:hypothetical protein A3F65_00715 [Candidatus Saccharibacteria bacterium RIFCSPHIGHO2_12_FULL_47_16b]|nr:MAG: hypothetical protein A3F65_00715 [Candidatus Saccharibacteria bacterium RIFCSPHIGHO2_12_FULL_47_16b]
MAKNWKNLLRKLSKKWLLLAVAVLIVGGFLFWLSNKGDDDSTTKPGTSVNLEPPTKEEKDQVQKYKEQLADRGSSTSNTSQPSTASGKKSVTPFISSWGQNQSNDVEVRGYVEGIYEDGGTCTAALTKDGQQVSQSRTSVANAQNTSCGLITVPRSKLSPSVWSITLSYSSGSYEGSSKTVTLEVK